MEIVKTGLILSHSQISVWDRCQKSWEYSYQQGWSPNEKPGYFDIGTKTHELLAEWYRGNLKPENVSAIAQDWFSNPKLDPKVTSTAVNLIMRYIEDYAPYNDTGWEVLGVEEHFQVPFITPGGLEFELQGYVDLIVRWNGRIWVIDHKTGQKFWTPSECMMDGQTPTYVAALQKRDGEEIFGIIYNMFNTYSYKNMNSVEVEKLFKREKTYRTPIELDGFLDELYKAVEDIWRNRNNTHRRSLKKDCSRCFFQDPCLLELKGADVTMMWEGEYHRKGNKDGERQVS